MTLGNVVIGFTTDSYLMLDADCIRLGKLVKWCREYTKEYDLGSVLIARTSINKQLTIDRKKLPDNYCAVFGQPIPWQEVIIHVENAYKDGIVNKEFRDMRYLGHITERVNRKNSGISYPKVFKYIPNGNNEGCKEYLRWWKYNRKVGAFLMNKDHPLDNRRRMVKRRCLS